MEALKREGFIPTTDEDETTPAPPAQSEIRGFVEVVGERDKRLVYRFDRDFVDLTDLSADQAVEKIRRTMLQPA
jgi:hypothetical protein